MDDKIVLLHIATQKTYIFFRKTYLQMDAIALADWQYLRDEIAPISTQAKTTPLQTAAPTIAKKGCGCKKR